MYQSFLLRPALQPQLAQCNVYFILNDFCNQNIQCNPLAVLPLVKLPHACAASFKNVTSSFFDVGLSLIFLQGPLLMCIQKNGCRRPFVCLIWRRLARRQEKWLHLYTCKWRNDPNRWASIFGNCRRKALKIQAPIGF